MERLSRWFHRWGSPPWFYERSQRWERVTGWLAAILLPIALLWGLVFAPPDYQQGNSFRIIYLHVPSATLAQSAWLFMATCGLGFLVWRVKMADLLLRAAIPLGAAFCFLALFTGSVWGKPTWGTWWDWDARITAMLLLLFLYIGAWGLGQSLRDAEGSARILAILAIVGAINIPIIKYSVDWWYTLHQPATFKLTQKPSMPPSMYLPLIVAVIGFYSLFIHCLFVRARNLILDRERRSAWLKRKLSEET